ncbi:hypothetical protein P7K49_016269 [Saguinus oedipus]|uniref:Uncharacterized protein n=1 Tax=Saguinus oedipus TaxID=9490 RepID=A0ABQ9VCE4_SAGOE|nr:hypothetical protein P7K49_016269 [Saguinus oedipus]
MFSQIIETLHLVTTGLQPPKHSPCKPLGVLVPVERAAISLAQLMNKDPLPWTAKIPLSKSGQEKVENCTLKTTYHPDPTQTAVSIATCSSFYQDFPAKQEPSKSGPGRTALHVLRPYHLALAQGC